jgi:hypothetical protein
MDGRTSVNRYARWTERRTTNQQPAAAEYTTAVGKSVLGRVPITLFKCPDATFSSPRMNICHWQQTSAWRRETDHYFQGRNRVMVCVLALESRYVVLFECFSAVDIVLESRIW